MDVRIYEPPGPNERQPTAKERIDDRSVTFSEHATGEVKLEICRGHVMVRGRRSPNSLYSEDIATMEGGGSYNQDDATGFLRIAGLPLRVQARRRKGR